MCDDDAGTPRRIFRPLVRLLAARDGLPPRLHLAHRLNDTSGVLLVSTGDQPGAAAHPNGLAHKEYLISARAFHPPASSRC